MLHTCKKLCIHVLCTRFHSDFDALISTLWANFSQKVLCYFLHYALCYFFSALHFFQSHNATHQHCYFDCFMAKINDFCSCTASSKIICSEWNNDSSSSNDWIFSRVSQKNTRFLHFSFSETNYLTRCLRRVLYSIFQKSG